MNIGYLEKIVSELPRNSKVLDAGCGSGIISKFIKKIRNDVNIYGIDKKSAKLPSFVKFKKCDVEKLTFKNSYFDAVFCFHVIEHLDLPKKAVDEFHRVLKKNGKLVVETPHWVSAITPVGYKFYSDKTHKKPFSKKSLKSLLSRFKVQKICFDTPVYFYLKEFDRKFLIPRKILNAVGLYKTVVWAYAIKDS
ncbi:MAG: class I SAM-dependent methyltransferase [Candidatus Aenigmatarchaeota archaeon]